MTQLRRAEQQAFRLDLLVHYRSALRGTFSIETDCQQIRDGTAVSKDG